MYLVQAVMIFDDLPIRSFSTMEDAVCFCNSNDIDEAIENVSKRLELRGSETVGWRIIKFVDGSPARVVLTVNFYDMGNAKPISNGKRDYRNEK